MSQVQQRPPVLPGYVNNPEKRRTDIVVTSPSAVDNPPLVAEAETDIQTPNPGKCSFCSKRNGVVPFTCKCRGTFCARHRLPEHHKCPYDHKTPGRCRLAETLPRIKAPKVDLI